MTESQVVAGFCLIERGIHPYPESPAIFLEALRALLGSEAMVGYIYPEVRRVTISLSSPVSVTFGFWASEMEITGRVIYLVFLSVLTRQ
jgi:hypothetical protein